MKWFHRHQWVTVSAHQMVSWFESPILKYKSDGGDITEVLQRCECNEIRTITLDGHWTLGEVVGRGCEANQR